MTEGTASNSWLGSKEPSCHVAGPKIKMTDRNHLWSIKEQFTRQGLKAGDAVSEPCSRRAFILVLLSIFWESRRPSCLPSCDGSCLHHLPSHHTLRRSPGKLEVPLLPHPPGETAARAGVGAHGPEPLGAAAAPQRQRSELFCCCSGNHQEAALRSLSSAAAAPTPFPGVFHLPLQTEAAEHCSRLHGTYF